MQNKLVQKRLKMQLLRAYSVFNLVTLPSFRHSIIGLLMSTDTAALDFWVPSFGSCL